MSPDPTPDYLAGLVTELRKLSTETPWLEFKKDNDDPLEIGEYISALSNAAALHGKANAYVVWGIEDGTHEVLGTNFKPRQAKKGGEELENWLLRLLDPRLHFRFFELSYEGKPVVLLEIPRASGKPVQFQGVEHIRVGTYRQKLKDHPQIERELWRVFNAVPFEDMIAMERVEGPQVLALLDYPSYFDMLKQELPSDRDGILARLADDRMIAPNQAGG